MRRNAKRWLVVLLEKQSRSWTVTDSGGDDAGATGGRLVHDLRRRLEGPVTCTLAGSVSGIWQT